jgi:hypothetical protein
MMSKKKTTHAEHHRHEHEAPQIELAQQAIVYLPLTLSASLAFAREVDSAEQRYRNHYGHRGAVVGGVLGHLIQREGLR